MNIQDAEADVKAFLDETGFDLPLLPDPDAAIAAQYGVTGIPTLVVVDGEGRIVSTKVGGVGYEELVSLAQAAQ